VLERLGVELRITGQLVVPKKPGLGLAFDQAAMKRYQVG